MRRHVAVTAMVSLLVVACNGENRPIADMGSPGVVPPNNGREPLKGALTDPIGTITAANFRGAIDNIKFWNGGSEADRCTDATWCGLGFSKVPVSIQPALDAVNANFENVGAKGTILIRLKNSGGRRTGDYSRYHLEPGKTYYVVVKSDGVGGGQWGLVPFEYNQNDPPKYLGDGGSFYRCAHEKKRLNAHAGFYTCDAADKVPDDAASSTERAALGDFGMIGALMHFAAWAPGFLRQSPGWVSCAFGCCTLEGS